ncbi:MAG: DNA polymerase I [Evtepia sp.]
MKLLVIDGNSIVNRTFYGLQPLSTQDGTPTHAIFGFLNIVDRLIADFEPDALCVAFDRREPTFRHLAYDNYKAQRKGMPEDLAVQIPLLKDALDAMNIPRYELAGWEADDLIGTISRRCDAAGWHCTIVTGDKDALQLITAHTSVNLISSRMGKTATNEIDPAVFREQYGFEPPFLVDLKALMGDASDNIPGVKGVGEKTAFALLHEFGSLKTIYQNLDAPTLKPAVRKKLVEGEARAKLSYDLATIHCDAPFDFKPEDARRKPFNNSILYQLFTKLEFSKLIDKFGLTPEQGDAPAVTDCTNTHDFQLISDTSQLDSIRHTWETAAFVAVLPLPNLRGVATALADHVLIFLDDQTEGYTDFLHALFSPKVKKIAHQVKDIMHLLLENNLPIEGFIFDTALAAYLLAPTDGSYDLELLARTYFDKTLPSAKKTYLAKDAFAPIMDQTGAMTALADHADLIPSLYETLAPRLDEFGMRTLYDTVEFPLCPVLAEMEVSGFLIDRTALSAFGTTLKARILEMQSEIYAQAGETFNINSTQQLSHILFETLGLPSGKKTKTGFSTGIEVLEKLKGTHPIIDALIEYRQITKLNSTYVDGLDKVIGPDGRIHTSFQNTVTATGRLSSTEPNLQNIPIRTPLGAQLRHMFVAPSGQKLVDADYSQIELRLLAHIAKDQDMLAAFQSGTDIHTMTASQVFSCPPDEVTPQMRRNAKAVNFGIVYGISAFSLSQDIAVTKKEADDYIQRYFATYAGVRDYMDHVVLQAKQDGYVRTLLGRRRWLPELTSSHYTTRSFGERVALNMPIQGTAADIMKLAMIRVHTRLHKEKLHAKLVLQIHDELIVECPDSETEHVKKLLTEEMEGAVSFSVPLEAVATAGQSWAEAKE